MESERRAAIVLLLGSRDDHLPVLVSSSVVVAGFANKVVVDVTCEDCLANGRVMPGCMGCGGRGYLSVFRRRDPYDTGASVYLAGREHEARRRRDSEIERLGVALEAPRPDRERVERAEQWEVDRDWRWARFDFAALDRALDELRVADEAAWQAVFAVFGYGVVPEEGRAAVLAERGLVFLDGRLPRPLRVPGIVVPRDEMIRRRLGEGVPTRVVAAEFGLSPRRINEILAAGEGPS